MEQGQQAAHNSRNQKLVPNLDPRVAPPCAVSGSWGFPGLVLRQKPNSWVDLCQQSVQGSSVHVCGSPYRCVCVYVCTGMCVGPLGVLVCECLCACLCVCVHRCVCPAYVFMSCMCINMCWCILACTECTLCLCCCMYVCTPICLHVCSVCFYAHIYKHACVHVQRPSLVFKAWKAIVSCRHAEEDESVGD